MGAAHERWMRSGVRMEFLIYVVIGALIAVAAYVALLIYMLNGIEW